MPAREFVRVAALIATEAKDAWFLEMASHVAAETTAAGGRRPDDDFLPDLGRLDTPEYGSFPLWQEIARAAGRLTAETKDPVFLDRALSDATGMTPPWVWSLCVIQAARAGDTARARTLLGEARKRSRPTEDQDLQLFAAAAAELSVAAGDDALLAEALDRASSIKNRRVQANGRQAVAYAAARLKRWKLAREISEDLPPEESSATQLYILIAWAERTRPTEIAAFLRMLHEGGARADFMSFGSWQSGELLE
jgi:hypothetical protein